MSNPLKPTDLIFGVSGLASSIFATFFLLPVKAAIGVSSLLTIASGVGLYVRSTWICAKPNQWLVVIRDGKLHKAGVGLGAYLGLTDSTVIFSSKLQSVNLYFSTPTVENQNISITGFANWTVLNTPEGAYKFTQNVQIENGEVTAAEDKVRRLCEGHIKHVINNARLNDVVKNRVALKKRIQEDLEVEANKLGLQIQVDLIEVIIQSEQIFTDLQKEFRSETNLKAQQIQMKTKEKVNQFRQQTEAKMQEVNQSNQTEKMKTKNLQSMKRANVQAEYDNQKSVIELQKIKRLENFQLQKLKSDLLQEGQRTQNKQALDKVKQSFSLEFDQEKLVVDKEHTSKTLQKYQIDSIERIYDKLNLKEMKIAQFVEEGRANLGTILPQMSTSKFA